MPRNRSVAAPSPCRRGSRQCQSRPGRGRPRPRPAIQLRAKDIPTTCVCKSDLPISLRFSSAVYTCASSDFYDSLGHASTDRVTRKPVCPRWELQPDGQLQRRRSGRVDVGTLALGRAGSAARRHRGQHGRHRSRGSPIASQPDPASQATLTGLPWPDGFPSSCHRTVRFSAPRRSRHFWPSTTSATRASGPPMPGPTAASSACSGHSKKPSLTIHGSSRRCARSTAGAPISCSSTTAIARTAAMAA